MIAVETTGDWIKLSIASTTFAFWFVDTILCVDPIPTLVISKVFGMIFRASSALLASLIAFSLNLTTYMSFGSLLVNPIPTKLVVAIPIEFSDPTIPVSYLTNSPLTKKWFGIIIKSLLISTMEELYPSKYLSKIGSFLWVKSNALLISLSVPS